MRIKISVLLAAAALLVGASTASAFSGGTAQGGTSCSPCHGSASGSAPSISGPATLLPSETATYTASIAASLVGAGLDVATTAGSLTATAAGTTLMTGEVVHSQRNNGVFSYSFDVTAPAALGDFDLLAAMLTYDENFQASGDLWNTITARITVVPEPGTLLMTGLGLAALATAARRRRA